MFKVVLKTIGRILFLPVTSFVLFILLKYVIAYWV